MHRFTKILCVFAAALVVTVYESGAAEVNCKAIISDMTKRQLNGISKCTKSMTFKNGKDKAAKMTCILKCVMMAEGVLSAEGKMDMDTFNAFLQKEVPEALREKAMSVLGQCQEKHASTLDPSEEFCKSYDPLIKCFMGAVIQLCPSK